MPGAFRGYGQLSVLGGTGHEVRLGMFHYTSIMIIDCIKLTDWCASRHVRFGDMFRASGVPWPYCAQASPVTTSWWKERPLSRWWRWASPRSSTCSTSSSEKSSVTRSWSPAPGFLGTSNIVGSGAVRPRKAFAGRTTNSSTCQQQLQCQEYQQQASTAATATAAAR